VITVRKFQINSIFFTGLAVWLALAIAPTLSAASIFDIPLPTTCINGSSPGTCPDGRMNGAEYQGSVGDAPYLGDVFYVPTNWYTNIQTLSFWIAADTFPSSDTISLYFGSIDPNDYSGSLTQVATNGNFTDEPSAYLPAGGTTAQYLDLSDNTTLSNIYEITFGSVTNLNLPLTPGGTYGWAVVATNSDGIDSIFAPLVSFLDRADTNIPYGGDNYGALNNFSTSDFGATLQVGYTADEKSITDFNYPPSVDFVTNPEPSTLGLLAIGMGLLGLKIRRRK